MNLIIRQTEESITLLTSEGEALTIPKDQAEITFPVVGDDICNIDYKGKTYIVRKSAMEEFEAKVRSEKEKNMQAERPESEEAEMPAAEPAEPEQPVKEGAGEETQAEAAEAVQPEQPESAKPEKLFMRTEPAEGVTEETPAEPDDQTEAFRTIKAEEQSAVSKPADHVSESVEAADEKTADVYEKTEVDSSEETKPEDATEVIPIVKTEQTAEGSESEDSEIKTEPSEETAPEDATEVIPTVQADSSEREGMPDREEVPESKAVESSAPDAEQPSTAAAAAKAKKKSRTPLIVTIIIIAAAAAAFAAAWVYAQNRIRPNFTGMYSASTGNDSEKIFMNFEDGGKLTITKVTDYHENYQYVGKYTVDEDNQTVTMKYSDQSLKYSFTPEEGTMPFNKVGKLTLTKDGESTELTPVESSELDDLLKSGKSEYQQPTSEEIQGEWKLSSKMNSSDIKDRDITVSFTDTIMTLSGLDDNPVEAEYTIGDDGKLTLQDESGIGAQFEFAINEDNILRMKVYTNNFTDKSSETVYYYLEKQS